MMQKIRPYMGRILILLIAIIAVVAFFNMRQYGWVEVSVPQNTPTSATFSIHHDATQEVKEFTVARGTTKKVRVKTGLVRVDSSSGRISSVDMVLVSGFGTTKLTAPTGQQRAVQQRASDIRFCPLLTADHIFSYDCHGEGPIIHHTQPKLGNTRNTTIFDGQVFARTFAIKDGLLAWRGGELNENVFELYYVQPSTGLIHKIQMPEDIRTTQESLPDIVTPPNPITTQFALVYTGLNRVYLYDSPEDTSPVRIEPRQAKTTDNGRISRGSFSDDRFLLYLGTSEDINEGERGETTKQEQVTKNHLLLEYDFSGRHTQATSLPTDIDSQGMYKLSNDFYLAQDNEGFDFYHREKNKLKQVYSMTGMASWALNNGKAYIQKDSILYEFSPKVGGLFSFHSLFSSTEINVSRLFAIGDNIFFTGYAKSSLSTGTNLYQLLNEAEKGMYDPQASNSVLEPVFKNMKATTDGAITVYQATNLQYAIDGFLEMLPTKTTEVLITNVTIEPHDPMSDRSGGAFGFDLTLDESQTYRGRVEYTGLLAVNLRIFDRGGVQQYESGIITGSAPRQ